MDKQSSSKKFTPFPWEGGCMDNIKINKAVNIATQIKALKVKLDKAEKTMTGLEFSEYHKRTN